MLHGHVNGQALKIDTPVIAADSLNYITARFTFSTDWNGLTKVAHFSNGSESTDIELTNDAIRAEDGLNLTEGFWDVTLTGHELSGGEVIKRITTVRENLQVEPSGVEDGEPLPTLPSQGEEILAEVTDIWESWTALLRRHRRLCRDRMRRHRTTRRRACSRSACREGTRAIPGGKVIPEMTVSHRLQP